MTLSHVLVEVFHVFFHIQIFPNSADVKLLLFRPIVLSLFLYPGIKHLRTL